MSGAIDWIFVAVGGALALLALWLLYRSILKDRARGRRRCPKCWYDMSGTAGMTCSECGYLAKRERKFVKTRRRWRGALGAMVLLVLAGAMSRGPRFIQGGWVRAVPTTAIILMLPWIEDQLNGSDWRAAMLDELLQNRINITSTTRPRQLRPPNLWDWQWRWIADRGLARLEQFPDDPEGGRQYLPAGEPYWTILDDALVRGVLNRLRLHDRYGMLLPPPMALAIESPCVAGYPVRFTIRPNYTPRRIQYFRSGYSERGMTLREWSSSLKIISKDGTALQWKDAESYRGVVALSPDSGVMWLPKSPTTRGVSVQMRDPDMHDMLCAQNLTVHIVDVDRVLQPDPRLDEVFINGTRFELHLNQPAPTVGVRVNEDCVLAADSFNSFVASIAIVRDGDVMYRAPCKFKISLGSVGPWGSALAVANLDEETVELLREAREANEPGWSLRFELDREQMLLWTASSRGMKIWSGVVEQPLVWPAKSDRVENTKSAAPE